MSRGWGLLAFLFVLDVAIAADDYQPLPLNQVPKAVRDAVMKKYPDAKPQDAHQGTNENKPYIDVHVLVKNQKVWITCDPDGTIRIIDREITAREIPEQVTAAMNRKYPKAVIRLINEIAEGNSVTYDLAIIHAKKQLVARFSAGGEFLEELDDEP